MLSTRQAATSGSSSLTQLLAGSASGSASLPRRLFCSTALVSSASTASSSTPALRSKQAGKQQQQQQQQQQEGKHRRLADKGAFKFEPSQPSTSQHRRSAGFQRSRSGSNGRERFSSAQGGERRIRERDASGSSGGTGKGSMEDWLPVMHSALGEASESLLRRNDNAQPSSSSSRTRIVSKAEQALCDKLDWYRNQARRGDSVALYRQAAELIELVPENRDLVKGSVSLQGQYIWLMCNAGRVKEAVKQIESMKKSGICPTPSQYGILFAGLANQADVKSHTTLLERCASYFSDLLSLGTTDAGALAKTLEARMSKGGTSALLATSRAKVIRQAANDSARFHAACASYIRLLVAAERTEEARATYKNIARQGKTHIQCIDAVLDSIRRTDQYARTPMPRHDANLVKELIAAVKNLQAPQQIVPEFEHHVHRLKYVVRRLAYLCMQPVEGETSKPEFKLVPLLRCLVEPSADARLTSSLPEALRVQALGEVSFYYALLACICVRDTKLLGLMADKCLRTADVRVDCFSPHGLPPFRSLAVRALRLCADAKDAPAALALLLASRGTDKWEIRTANFAHPMVVSYFYAMSAAPNWNTAKAIFRMYTFDRMNGVFKTDLKYGDGSHQIRWKGREAPPHKADKQEKTSEGEEKLDAKLAAETSEEGKPGKEATSSASSAAPTSASSATASSLEEATASLVSPPPVFYTNSRSTVERLQDQLSSAAANREDLLITRLLLSASSTLDAHGVVDHTAVLESLRLLNVLRPFDAHSGAPLRDVEAHEALARLRPAKGAAPSAEHHTAQAKLQLARTLMSSINIVRDSPRGQVVPGETEALSKVHRRALRCVARLTGKSDEREQEQQWMMRGVVGKSAGLKLTAEDFRELRRGGDA